MADRAADVAVTEGDKPPFCLLSNITKARRLILDRMLTPSRRLRSRVPNIGIQASAILSQLASGCCGLNGYLFEIRRVFEPSCPRCGYHKETVTHFFQFWPVYISQRKSLRKALRQERILFNPSDISSALKNLKSWPASEIFVRSSNRLAALKDVVEDPTLILNGPTCPSDS